MKRTLLLILPALFLGTACERHSASSLPDHGGGHAGGHAAAPAEKAPAPEAPSKAANTSASKFFETQPK